MTLETKESTTCGGEMEAILLYRIGDTGGSIMDYGKDEIGAIKNLFESAPSALIDAISRSQTT